MPTTQSSDQISNDIKFRLSTEFGGTPGMMRAETVVVKEGPRVWKSASLLLFGNTETGEVSRRELRFKTWRPQRGALKGDDEGHTWYCEEDEIERVRTLLNGDLNQTGSYHLVDDESPISEVLNLVKAGALASEDITGVTAALMGVPGLREALASSDEGRLFAQAVAIHQRSAAIDKLAATAVNPLSSEQDLQDVLSDEWWIFGGQFIGREKRRSLTVLDQLDIPLIRNDGSLHIVELKKANITQLVRKQRNHWIAGYEVHEAVSQAENYLRSLDEQRATILADLRIDSRRASATVVIGHPQFVTTASEDEISEAIRTYNSHLSRVTVLTYKELIDGASQAVNLSGEMAK